jgi:protein ImuB
MLEQVILRAISQLVVLASVTLTLDLDGGMTHSRTVHPALPGNDRQFWFKLLHLDLAAHPPPAAILAATLDGEPGKTRTAQLGLFAPQLPEPGRLDLTLARIRAVVGEENAGRAVLQDTHQPDRFRVEPFSISAVQTDGCAAAPARPAMRRLRPAVAVPVTWQDAQPAAFVFRAQRYTVEHAYGPWQSSGDWWNPMLWAREEWDVVARTREGTTLYCCLVHDLIHAQWQMVALYD